MPHKNLGIGEHASPRYVQPHQGQNNEQCFQPMHVRFQLQAIQIGLSRGLQKILLRGNAFFNLLVILFPSHEPSEWTLTMGGHIFFSIIHLTSSSPVFWCGSPNQKSSDDSITLRVSRIIVALFTLRATIHPLGGVLSSSVNRRTCFFSMFYIIAYR